MDREKVINELVEHIESELAMCSEWADGVRVDLLQYAVALLKEQETVEHALEVLRKAGWKETQDAPFPAELLKEQEAVVRCKDCKWRGNKKKCIVAFVADKQEFPCFFYDDHGEWFCSDGER